MSSRQHDYIPRPLAQFNEWYTNLINYIKQVTFAQDNPWTHIPDDENNRLHPHAGVAHPRLHRRPARQNRLRGAVLAE
jgi:hypothetical protein